MRTVLLGDSHLARVQRDLPLIGDDVVNAAQGGASTWDLLTQASNASVTSDDVVVLSVGTNDAAPWKRVPLAEFRRALTHFLLSMPAQRWVYVTPPGVDESRLTGAGDRTNSDLDEYRSAAVAICAEAGARVVRAERIIAPLGADAFVSDGLHLSGHAYALLLPAIADAAG